MNDFYTKPADNTPLTTIRSADENSDRQSVETAFDKLPTENELKRAQYGVDESTIADLFEITVPYQDAGYTEGQEITFEAAITSTGTSSVQINGLGIVELVDINNQSLIAGTVTAGQLITMIYTSSGTFRLVNSTTDAATATTAAIAAQTGAETAQTGAETAETGAEAALAAAEAILTIVPQTGGGTLTAMRINELRDGSTFDLPAANSLGVNEWIIIELPDLYEHEQPIVDAAGADLIHIREGTDTRIIFNSGSTWMRLTSDGVSNWRL